MSGIETSASGSSAGVPGTTFTRGSRWAWLTSTASRCSAAQPVIPSPKCSVCPSSFSAHWSRESTGSSSRRGSSAE